MIAQDKCKIMPIPLKRESLLQRSPVSDSLISELEETAREASALTADLEVIVAVKVKDHRSTSHGKVDFSKPPGNAQVLNTIMDLHEVSREGERMLRLSLGLPSRERGGSTRNTLAALEALVKLAPAAPEPVVRDQLRHLQSWCRKATTVLGRTEMPKRLPRNPGEQEPRCPWCHFTTLRTFPLDGSIRCIKPHCQDDQGRKPRGDMEYFGGEMVIRWQDGVIGLPSGEAA